MQIRLGSDDNHVTNNPSGLTPVRQWKYEQQVSLDSATINADFSDTILRDRTPHDGKNCCGQIFCYECGWKPPGKDSLSASIADKYHG